ncbi:protein POLYCHOME-like [Panicum miliaceum]|uniref:Protein POLYCHOME-like n=1 Tax=Panicum miliaceum TaxID=4540 RepID=A0A3L6QBW3_PANMI|nr:protein POLYCHOME-like [Panicum miliaceum]
MGTGEISRIDPEEDRKDSGHQEQDKSRIANYKMPEVRTATRPAIADISGGGFFIRRVAVAPPGAVLALERSRLQDAAARQQIQWTEDSSVDPIIPVQAESTPTTEEAQAVAAPATSLADGKLKTSSPSDCSLQATPSKPNDSALVDLTEKKLSRSIEQNEKIVSQLLKETPKATQPPKVAVQRRTLMSMR